MALFRRKPVVIEAVRIEDRNCDPPRWLEEANQRGDVTFFGDRVAIKTLEGTMIARPGDWILRGVAGIYPCRADIFEKTYEPVDEAELMR